MFGQSISNLISAVDPRLAGGMIEADEASSYTIILSPPNTDRIFLHCPGTNDTFGAGDVDYAALQQADLFHFGYPQLMKRMYERQGAELVDIYKRAKVTGITTSLDTTMPDPNAPSGQVDWQPIFQAVLPYVDIFTPSIEEILMMLHPETFRELVDQASQEGVDLVDLITPRQLSELAAELLAMGGENCAA